MSVEINLFGHVLFRVCVSISFLTMSFLMKSIYPKSSTFSTCVPHTTYSVRCPDSTNPESYIITISIRIGRLANALTTVFSAIDVQMIERKVPIKYDIKTLEFPKTFFSFRSAVYFSSNNPQ